MADWSTKLIEEVVVGDMVMGADQTGRTFPVRVTRTYDSGPRECVRTVFAAGKRDDELVFVSTTDHKVLSSTLMSSCKEAALNNVLRQLPVGKVGKKFFAIPTAGFDDGGLAHEPWALLLGLLLGDGCYTAALNCDPHLSCADELLIADLESYLASLNLRLKRLDAGGGLMYRLSSLVTPSILRDGETGRVLPGLRNPVKRKLDSLDMLGKYAHEKVIPAEAYGWDNQSVAALVAGLFVTDGSVYQNAAFRLPFAGFCSTSRTMVVQFRELVGWRFGIHFGPVKTQVSGRKRALYSVELAKYVDVKRFQSAIPLVGVKRRTFADLVSAAEALMTVTNVRNRAKLDAPFRMRRKGQVSVGVHPTHDIEVDHPDHLFVMANGLIVSNSKHSGGVAGNVKQQTGFPQLDQLISIPHHYPGGAVHAQEDGTVQRIADAPQGGRYLYVNDHPHWVDPDLDLNVQAGDKVEAGDPLTDGLENPAEYVRHKGIGEARRRFVDVFHRTAVGAGFRPHKRNLELMARGLIDHVRLNEETGENVPGDVVSYSALEHGYEPRPGHAVVAPKEALGQYLERPVLHHTIGTRVRPSMLSLLERHGVASLTVHPEPAPFDPVMVRSHDVLSTDPDVLTKMLGSGLEKNLLRDVHRGRTSDPYGTSFVPALSAGIDFGVKGKTVGFDPKPGGG
jgi:hypothetical protein